MLEQLASGEFWKDQWHLVSSAPWLFIPTILIALAVGWKLKGSIDDGEIRGLKADRDAHKSRRDREIGGLKAQRDAYKTHLDLVRSKGETDTGEIAVLRYDLQEIKRLVSAGDQRSALSRLETAELRTTALASTNNEIVEIASDVSIVESGPISIISKSNE